MNIEKYSQIAPQYYSGEIPLMLKKYLKRGKFTTILDCGCGDGSLLYSLNRAELLGGKKVTAIDLSEKRIALVRKIAGNIVANIDSAEELTTINDDSIDFFISTQVIEHVNDRKMIKKIEEKVRREGIIYISTVFKKWYGWYFYRNNSKWVLDPTHLREYSNDSQLIDLFDKNKFKLLEQRRSLQWFPVSDFFIKRMGLVDRKLYENKVMRWVRKIRIPIFGYYNWEIVLEKI